MSKMMMMILPEDVIHEILLRLPATSILNCKYVCKTWFSLISDRNFVKHHLDHTIHNKKQSNKFMFMVKDDTEPYHPLVSIRNSSSSLVSPTADTCVEIDPPLTDLAPYPIHLLVSCNGLVCIMFHQTSTVVDDELLLIVIWNPTTGEYKILPPGNSQTDRKKFSIYSFGYDHAKDDYKFLKGEFSQDGFVDLPPSEEEEDTRVAEVYSLQSDTWRSIDPVPCHMRKYVPGDSVSGVLVNGHRHWLAKCKYITKGSITEEFIVSFDFGEERFKQMHLPRAYLDDRGFRPLWTVGVLDERLCVVDGIWKPGFQLEIWVMQDYGVVESWTLGFVIHHTEARQLFDVYPLRVIWCFEDGRILLLQTMDERRLVLYDPKQDTMTVISSLVILGAENYVESLVPLNSGIYVGSRREYANSLLNSDI